MVIMGGGYDGNGGNDLMVISDNGNDGYMIN